MVRSLGSVREITFTKVWGKLVNFSFAKISPCVSGYVKVLEQAETPIGYRSGAAGTE